LQVEAPLSAQSPSGSVPALMLPQVPLEAPVLANEHAWQRPKHDDAQQKLSTQLPLWHSSPLLHEEPFDWGV
jgi:hypothetical protein